MNEREIIDILNRILDEMGFPAVEEHYYKHPMSDFLMLDSLDKVELIINIEKRFGITITNEATEAIATFHDCVECVKDLTSFKPLPTFPPTQPAAIK